uniref:G protein-coupled receptor n=1 Tax=Panagrellus redivivus TaxID=6233 RepID=A0A7E4UZS7_PANRE
MLLAGVWVYDSFWKESNVHPGMNIIFHSVVLISGIFFVTRTMIIYDAFNRSKLSVTLIVLVNYFHDTAYFQLPMTPVLMTLERLFATKLVKTYELSQSTGAVTCLVLVSWTYAISVNFASVCSLGSEVYFRTAYMHCVLQTGTIVFMICIYRKNLKRYQQIKAKTLTERYQTAENIRLLRATFKVAVIMVMWNSLMFTVSFVLKVPNVPAIVILYHTFDKTVIPVNVIVLANYFHDCAYYQLPMTPVLMTFERLMATKLIKTYEQSQPTGAVTCLVLVSWTYAIWIHFMSVYSKGRDVYFMTIYIQCVLQTLTIFLMVYIYRQNLKRYRQIMVKTLTERYQTAENIRLLRTVFKFTIINIIWNGILTGFSLVFKIDDLIIRKIFIRVWDIFIAIGILLILLIYLNAVGILQKVHSLVFNNKKTSSKVVIIRSVTGYVVPTTAEADDYFRQLKNSWQ